MPQALPIAAVVLVAAGFGAGWIARPTPPPRFLNDAEIAGCVHGLGIAADIGPGFDRNTALERAEVLGRLAQDMPEGEIREAARGLASTLPRRLAEDDNPQGAGSDLLSALRKACDSTFTRARYESRIEEIESS